MSNGDDIYRLLQQHLDRQAVGFPAVGSGADIRLLRRLFTPEEAGIALHMSYRPAPTAVIADKSAPDVSEGQTSSLLNSMFNKGAIGWKKKDGIDHWHVMPLVVGMYEAQDGAPSTAFLEDADAYMKTMGFAKSFLSVKPSQMRTIPINKVITAEHRVAGYDHIRAIVASSPGPFVVLKCICRESKALRNTPCAKTSRQETCLVMGDMAAMVLRRKHCREVSRDEVLAILQMNEDDGLVLQPANYERPEFVCSCCGCCCGMLSFQKFLPRPVDFWTSNFQAEVDADRCSGCGACVDRCQVNAVSLTGPSGEARINVNRCIGCGVCVPTCPSEAMRLKKKEAEAVPPATEEDLHEEIMRNKKGAADQLKMLLKAGAKMKQ